MNTAKGYIVPVILIFLLLILAGFFVFQETAESPVVEIEIPVIPQNIQISTSTIDSLNATTTDILDEDESTLNSTTTISATSSLDQLENE